MATSKIQKDRTPWTSAGTHLSYSRSGNCVSVRCNNGNDVKATRNGTNIGTLPAGVRPPNQLDFAGTSLGGSELVFFRVEASGNVLAFSNIETVYWSGVFMYLI